MAQGLQDKYWDNSSECVNKAERASIGLRGLNENRGLIALINLEASNQDVADVALKS